MHSYLYLGEILSDNLNLPAMVNSSHHSSHNCKSNYIYLGTLCRVNTVYIYLCFEDSGDLSNWDDSFEYPWHMLWSLKIIF